MFFAIWELVLTFIAWGEQATRESEARLLRRDNPVQLICPKSREKESKIPSAIRIGDTIVTVMVAGTRVRRSFKLTEVVRI